VLRRCCSGEDNAVWLEFASRSKGNTTCVESLNGTENQALTLGSNAGVSRHFNLPLPFSVATGNAAANYLPLREGKLKMCEPVQQFISINQLVARSRFAAMLQT
jgi:hypothetical protein